MVCELVTGRERCNGLVTGTVSSPPERGVKGKSELSERSPQVFPKLLVSPVVSFSLSPPLWSTTKVKWFYSPFGLDCVCFGPRLVLRERQFLASLAIQALSSCKTFCPSSFFFSYGVSLHFHRIISSQRAKKKIKNLPKHSSCPFFSKQH